MGSSVRGAGSWLVGRSPTPKVPIIRLQGLGIHLQDRGFQLSAWVLALGVRVSAPGHGFQLRGREFHLQGVDSSIWDTGSIFRGMDSSILDTGFSSRDVGRGVARGGALGAASPPERFWGSAQDFKEKNKGAG